MVRFPNLPIAENGLEHANTCAICGDEFTPGETYIELSLRIRGEGDETWSTYAVDIEPRNVHVDCIDYEFSP